MSKFMNLVKEVVEQGIPVTLEFDRERGTIYADLNFQAKSHGCLYEQDDGSLTLQMRYDMSEVIENLEDLMYAFKRAMCGRDFGNFEWLRLCEKHGVIKKITETKVTVSYK